MATITRKATGEESLTLEQCPCCGGEVKVRDCGYTTFNPADVKCQGECKREWKFSDVDDQWDAGLRWNKLAASIKRRLYVFSLLKVDRRLTPSRNYHQEDLEKEAESLRMELESVIIGASKAP